MPTRRYNCRYKWRWRCLWRGRYPGWLPALLLALLSSLLLGVLGCHPTSTSAPALRSPDLSATPASDPQREATPHQAPTPEDFARQLVAQLRERRIEALARAVHPELGLRFAPYATLDERDVILNAAELALAWQDRRQLRWGLYDGSGEPIELSLPDYFEEFVYDVDFATARVAVNQRLGQGNSISNLEQVYPSAQFVEFHRPGTERFGGLDWSSLRLVLVPRPDGGWWLLALVHDQWTI